MILFLITRCLHAKWRQHSKTSLGGVQYEVTVGTVSDRTKQAVEAYIRNQKQ